MYSAVLWILVGLSACVLVESYSTTFCLGKSSGFHRDPAQCDGFYNCVGIWTYWLKCPSGTYFNEKVQHCDWKSNVVCGTSPRHDTPGLFCGDKVPGIYADPEDCHMYFECGGGKTFHRTCQRHLLFNPVSKSCDWPKNVECSGKTPTAVPTQSGTVKTDNPPQITTAAAPKVTEDATNEKPSQNSGCKRVVCYFTNWAQYRNGDAKQLPDELDPFMCTHIVFAFAKLNGNVLAPYEWNDDDTDWSVGNYRKVTNMKQVNPDLKVLLAVGGWNMGSPPFMAMVANQKSRKEFIDTSIPFLRDRGFDGLDLDWEYPANRGSTADDKDRFSDLLRELRAAYTKEASETGFPRLLITAAVAAGAGVVNSAYDVPVLNSELDFINLMSYDLHGSWETKTGHNSPLYPGSWESGEDAELNTHWAANNWVKQGASRENLIIGVPLYGRTFRLTSSSNSQVGAPASGAGSAGPSTREKGFLAYYEICNMIRNGASKHFIDEQKVPYIVSNDQWVGYDDPASLKEKVDYILKEGYGGVMVWDLSLDDMKGSSCGAGNYPLMTTVNKACGK